MKIYFDTNIFIDFLENRKDKFRLLGEYASQVFNRALSCEFYIVISNLVVEELIDHGTSKKEIRELIEWLQPKIIKIKKTRSDEINAKKILINHKTHFKDAIHYVIASKESDKLLTNDNQLKELPNCVGYENL